MRSLTEEPGCAATEAGERIVQGARFKRIDQQASEAESATRR